jgi:hypothetical protein
MKDICAGESHSLSVDINGRVWAWGSGVEGQLGFTLNGPLYGDERDVVNTQGTTDFKDKYQPLPRQLPAFDAPVVSVDAQSRYSCAVTETGGLYTWGSGHSYQLGNGEQEDETTPFKVELKDRTCFSAACGGQFMMVLLDPKDEGGAAIATTGGSSGGVKRSSSQESDHGGKDPRVDGSAPTSSQESTPVHGAIHGNYRLPMDLPTSPIVFPTQHNQQQVRKSHRLSPLKESSSPYQPSPSVRTDQMEEPDLSGRVSPTLMLRSTMESVCVSPQRKKPRDASVEPFSHEERMAPWSPGKKKTATPSLFNAPRVGRGVSLQARFAASQKGGMMAGSGGMDVDPVVPAQDDSECQTVRKSKRQHQ